MQELMKKQMSATFCPLVIALLFFPLGSRAEGPAQPTPEISVKISASKAAKETGGKILTLDEAIRIALDNQPRIRAAQERVKAQQAVVGQAKSAYYLCPGPIAHSRIPRGRFAIRRNKLHLLKKTNEGQAQG